MRTGDEVILNERQELFILDRIKVGIIALLLSMLISSAIFRTLGDFESKRIPRYGLHSGRKASFTQREAV